MEEKKKTIPIEEYRKDKKNEERIIFMINEIGKIVDKFCMTDYDLGVALSYIANKYCENEKNLSVNEMIIGRIFENTKKDFKKALVYAMMQQDSEIFIELANDLKKVNEKVPQLLANLINYLNCMKEEVDEELHKNDKDKPTYFG